MKFLYIEQNKNGNKHYEQYAEQFAIVMGKEFAMLDTLPDDIETYCDDSSTDMLFLGCRNEKRTVQHMLDACRTLRLPYAFITDTMSARAINKILLPITMLEEEVHKAQIAAHIARYHKAEVLLLQAKDYGSKAQQNAQKTEQILKKFDLKYETILAEKDSFNLYKETTDRQTEWNADLIVQTASRDYGLDDILFGPPERHIVRQSRVPVVLVNPRGDLYTLCD